MLDNKLFLNAITQLREERNIPVETMKEALEEAFVKTYRKEFDPEAELRLDVDMEKGELNLIHLKDIVKIVEDELTQISLKEARKINKDYKVGDKHEIEIEFTSNFSALAALQVKQIIKQKIREKEKELILSEYLERIGDLIHGNIEVVKEHFFIASFEKTYGYLNKNQIPRGLNLEKGDKIKAAIINIDKNSKGLPIILSMNSPELVKRILEQEIPEINEGTIVINKIARYGGVRTKLIVKSISEGLDPVGAIIGEKGERIKRVIAEVGREYIDVIPFIEDKAQQISRAFVPAKPLHVKLDIDEEGNQKAIVVVSESDFSSAIGRGGSNAKVVSRLLDIEIEVKKESEIDFKIPKIVQEPTTSYKKSVDIDISKFMIEEEESDDFFDEVEEVKEDTNNFGFEKIADIPEINDFEGFTDEEDPLFGDQSQDDNSQDENSDDFDKYYE